MPPRSAAAKAHARLYRKTPWALYLRHRQNASHRGIDFDISFSDWWTIWESSGHWFQRGRGRGSYVMARFGDQGAYAVGNVKIIRNEENISEGNVGNQYAAGIRRTPEQLKKLRAAAFSPEANRKRALALRGNKNALGNRGPGKKGKL